MGIDPEELSQIIIPEIYQQVYQELTTANRGGEDELKQALKKWHYRYKDDNGYEDSKSYRVLVVGKSEVDTKFLIKKIQELGMNPDDFDFHPEYDNGYDFSILKDSNTYSDVIVGAMGHNQKGRMKKGSMISEMMLNPDHYPKTIECTTSGGNLKMTAQSFQNALIQTDAYSNFILQESEYFN